MIKRHWDSIAEAFKSEGILGALKRIGLVLLDVIMHPLQKILGWVAELTGWQWATNAAGSVEEFRKNMNLVSDEEKANTKKDEKPQEVTVVENKRQLRPYQKQTYSAYRWWRGCYQNNE